MATITVSKSMNQINESQIVLSWTSMNRMPNYFAHFVLNCILYSFALKPSLVQIGMGPFSEFSL